MTRDFSYGKEWGRGAEVYSDRLGTSEEVILSSDWLREVRESSNIRLINRYADIV